MGKYKKDANIIFNADRRSPDFIRENVRAKNITPQSVATIAELMPVMPNVAGSKPIGIRNIV